MGPGNAKWRRGVEFPHSPLSFLYTHGKKTLAFDSLSFFNGHFRGCATQCAYGRRYDPSAVAVIIGPRKILWNHIPLLLLSPEINSLFYSDVESRRSIAQLARFTPDPSMTRLSPLTNSITLKKRGTFKSWHTANYEDYANLLCRIQLMQFAHFDLIRESVLYEYF